MVSIYIYINNIGCVNANNALFNTLKFILFIALFDNEIKKNSVLYFHKAK